MGGLGEKINEKCSAVKNRQNDLTSKVELLNLGAPAQIPQPPQTLRETVGQQSWFSFSDIGIGNLLYVAKIFNIQVM